MGKRGKQPAIAKSTPVVKPLDNRPAPPKSLGKRAKEVWVSVVNSVPKNHFCEGELPLLIQYCTACETAERMEKAFASGEYQDFVPAGSQGLKPHPAYNIIAVSRAAMATLATKMKITSSSRLDRRTVGKAVADIAASGADSGRFAGLMFQDSRGTEVEQ